MENLAVIYTPIIVFLSLDFRGRTTLRLDEIAKKLGCTVQHLMNEVEAGELGALDLKGATSTRHNIKVPVECYREYVLRCVTGPKDSQVGFLATLPAALLREVIAECTRILKT